MQGASGINISQNWVYDTFAASFMQHYGVNNTVSSNVWARVGGRCLSFRQTSSAQISQAPWDRAVANMPYSPGTNQTYCPGYLWSPAYRGQKCAFQFNSNILLAESNKSSGAHYWHEPAEGTCNSSWAHNLYWNASAANGQLSATFPSIYRPQCPGYVSHW